MKSSADIVDVATVIAIPSLFRGYLEGALVKVGAQFPTCSFAINGNNVHILGVPTNEAASITTTVLHAVYREKIYVETLEMRQALVRTVMSP